MALLDEEVVEYWLNNSGFFCMRGVKTGLGEIDFLAIRPQDSGIEAWHVEVQVSFRPIGYIGGNTNAKRRSETEIIQGIDQWLAKKFLNQKKMDRRNLVLPSSSWTYVLVCAEVREPRELELLAERGVLVFRYSDIVAQLINGKSLVNSTAGTIIEILRYARDRQL